MESLIIIPARYGSTRFEGKPLALLGGIPIIQHVWERACAVCANVVVATDDERISDACKTFDAEVVMTSSNHKSGTDRCAEAWKIWRGNNPLKAVKISSIINLQGDEPFIEVAQIESLIQLINSGQFEIATLATPFKNGSAFDELNSPNSVKATVDTDKKALYFSRSVIPYLRDIEQDRWSSAHTFLKHIGIYAFKCDALLEVTALPSSSLEVAESLEQLRWLENGYKIGIEVVPNATIGIDTPEDLKLAEEHLKGLAATN